MLENFTKFPPFVPKQVLLRNENNENHEHEIQRPMSPMDGSRNTNDNTNGASRILHSSPSLTILRKVDERQNLYNTFISKLHTNPKLKVIDPDEVKYDLNQLIDNGSFGFVYKGTYISIPVAVKKDRYFSIYNIHDNDYQYHESRLIKELNTLADMSFPQFNQFFGVFIDKNTGELHTVHDLAICSLKKLLEQGPLSEEKKNRYAKQILNIVELLICKKLVVKDLAPKNFLIKKNGDLEICDFGSTSKMDTGEIIRRTSIQYTEIYAPPEFFIEGGICPTSDLWPTGMILYQIFYGKKFWDRHELKTYINNLKTQKINPTVNEDPKCPKIITEIIRGCLHHDPKRRTPIKEIIRMFDSYLASVYLSQLDSSPVLKHF